MNNFARIAAAGLIGFSLPAAALAQDAPAGAMAQDAKDQPPKDQSAPAPDQPAKSDATKDQPKPDQPPSPPQAKDEPTPPAPPPATTADTPTPPPAPPVSTTATTPDQPAASVPGNPNLTVATVKMDGGIRASKVIGASVTGANNQDLGTVNDLILDHDGKIVLGVLSVGSVLGMGGKLVAEPYAQFQMGKDGKLTLPGASKDQLSKQPGFTYSEQ